MSTSKISGIIRILDKSLGKYKKHILVLVVFGFISGILEGISVGAAIPLFSIVLNNGGEASNTISKIVTSVFKYLPFHLNLYSLLVIIILMSILRAIVLNIFAYVRVKISVDYRLTANRNLFNGVVKSRWLFIITQKLGYIQSLLVRDIAQSSALPGIIGGIILSFTGLFMYFFVAINISFWITVSVFILGGALLFLYKPLVKMARNNSYKLNRLGREIIHFLGEHVIGMKTVKSSAVEEKILSKNDCNLQTFSKLEIKAALLESFSSTSLQPIGVALIAVILLYASHAPDFNLIAFGAIIYLVQRIFTYLQDAQRGLHALAEVIPYVTNVNNFRETLAGNQEDSGTGQNFRFNRNIAFRDVDFSYPSGAKILNNINFSIGKGEMLGLIGPSGSGKTTIADLLLRFLKTTGGQILVDGENINDADLYNWRSRLGYVSQDIFLLNGTIEGNIRFYNEDLTREEIAQAAKEANIYDFIQTLPKKFATEVGDRGLMLSVGQRQRVALARVLARKPEILILDEATSALDNESEVLIHKAIENLRGVKTIFIIAHRLSSVLGVDNLLVLDKGSILEKGKPSDLLRDESSYFHRMYHLKDQVRGK